MKAGWDSVQLRTVVAPADRYVSPQAGTAYRQIGVKLWGAGAYERETIDGSQTKYTKLFRAETGDLVVNKIWARNGSVAVVSENLSGAYGSAEFPMYSPDRKRLDPAWMHWLTKTPSFWSQCDEKSQGTSGKNRIKPVQFLSVEIPLPPIAEQRRIVTRIEELAELIEEARRLRKEAADEADAMCRAIISQNADSKLTPMSELVRLRPSDVAVQSDKTYQFAGVYCFGRGVFRSVSKTGMEFAYPRLTRLRKDDFVYPKLMAWEGALGVVPEECDGMVVSTEFPVFEVLTDSVFPEVLDIHFKNPAVWPELSGSSTGTNVRRRRLNPGDFLKYQFPLPRRSVQETVRTVKAEVNAMNHLQSEAAAELDALLPAILDRAFKGDL